MNNKQGQVVREMAQITSIIQTFDQLQYIQSIPTLEHITEQQVINNVSSEDIQEVKILQLRAA